MTPEEITAAANALVTATQNTAVSSGQAIEANQAQLAPGLVTGSNAPGGLNYQRDIAPVVPALTADFVTAAKQGILRNSIRDAVNSAQVTLDEAKAGYQARQRAFQIKQAEQARERQRRADAQAAAALAAQNSFRGGGGGYSVGNVEVAENDKKFIGNNDVRGRLAYLASKGDNNAKIALQYVGNDNKYSLSPYITNPSVLSALNAVGAQNVYKVNAPAPPANRPFYGGTNFSIPNLVSGRLK